jgi:hypothetical protein
MMEGQVNKEALLVFCDCGVNKGVNEIVRLSKALIRT